ncbi:amino acid ABC transporter permease [Mesorhizobium sp. NZP2298]|uniref:amino acid ABC transporter permease n=1 Tax=Mesorhizobium sp. NZP2298 TaxID=2483403 RepID=UPI001551FE87|nr:amino acid ABC transporter permease [Mesorhizobium sp. NZP2298]QKC98327.1 amino acid ABC transporter permease [Mesorhizobium sp. NZP2298]
MFDYTLLLNATPDLVIGLGTTILVTIAAFLIATGLGLGLSAASFSPRRSIAKAAGGFVQVARATPEIIAIFWAYYCMPILVGANLSGLTCGIGALGLIGGGYMAEIVRGGILSIDRGQWEASASLGLPRYVVWFHIIMPQATRKMLPAVVNYFTDLLKATTLLAAIGVNEVAYAAYTNGSASFRYLEPLTGVAILFFLLIFPLSLLARHLNNANGASRKSR